MCANKNSYTVTQWVIASAARQHWQRRNQKNFSWSWFRPKVTSGWMDFVHFEVFLGTVGYFVQNWHLSAIWLKLDLWKFNLWLIFNFIPFRIEMDRMTIYNILTTKHNRIWHFETGYRSYSGNEGPKTRLSQKWTFHN